MAHFVSHNLSDFVWKMIPLDQTVGLNLGSLEAPGGKWTDRTSGLLPLARTAARASGIQTVFRETSFCRKHSAASKRDSESYGTRDGQGPSSHRWHHSLKMSQEGSARSSNPDHDGRKATGISSKTTGEESRFLVQRPEPDWPPLKPQSFSTLHFPDKPTNLSPL